MVVSRPWQPIASKTEDFALAPGPTPLALVTDRRDHSRVTTTHPLRHTAPVRVPTTQPRTPQDLARMNTAARDQPCSQPCSPRLAPQHSPPEELAIHCRHFTMFCQKILENIQWKDTLFHKNKSWKTYYIFFPITFWTGQSAFRKQHFLDENI